MKFQNALLRAQAETSPSGILAITGDRQILLANHRFREMWDTPEPLLASGLDAVVGHGSLQVADPAGFLRALARLDKHPDAVVHDEILMRDGRSLARYSAPLHSDEGMRLGRISYFRDITDLRRATDELREWKERYETAIRASGLVLFDWNAAEDVATWSGHCEAMLGYTAQELAHSVEFVRSLIHAEDRARVVRDLDGACRDRSRLHATFRMQHKNGFYVHVESSGCFFRVGDSDRMVGFLTDVSERKRGELALGNSERFARAIVDALTSALAILDESGEILTVNAAWHHFVAENCPPHGAIGIGDNYLQACESATAGGDDDAGSARATADGVRGVISGQRPEFYLEFPCASRSQAERWFALRATRFDAGSGTRVLLTHEDITARRNAERLEREKLTLREAVSGMEQVLGVVGHELRTPLASLRAISEFVLLDGARETPEWERFIGDIGEEVDRMSETVNNLLEAARLHSGRARWNWGVASLRDVCEEAIESIRPLVDPAKVELSLDVDPGLDAMRGDTEALRRLVTNLLSNARKFTTKGRIDVRVFGDLDILGGRWVQLVVSDTGSGIAPEVLARLGEAFALNSGVVGRNHVSGTGLGLAICKGIAAAHGGEIEFESRPGRGTRVTVHLCAELSEAQTGETVQLEEPETLTT